MSPAPAPVLGRPRGRRRPPWGGAEAREGEGGGAPGGASRPRGAAPSSASPPRALARGPGRGAGERRGAGEGPGASQGGHAVPLSRGGRAGPGGRWRAPVVAVARVRARVPFPLPRAVGGRRRARGRRRGPCALPFFPGGSGLQGMCHLTFSTEEERTTLLGGCQIPFTHQNVVSFQKQPEVRGSEQVPPSTTPFDSRAGNCPLQNEHTAPLTPGHPSLQHT